MKQIEFSKTVNISENAKQFILECCSKNKETRLGSKNDLLEV